MGEDELIELARHALERAKSASPGSFARKLQLAVYDAYASELGRRALRIVRELRDE